MVCVCVCVRDWNIEIHAMLAGHFPWVAHTHKMTEAENKRISRNICTLPSHKKRPIHLCILEGLPAPKYITPGRQEQKEQSSLEEEEISQFSEPLTFSNPLPFSGAGWASCLEQVPLCSKPVDNKDWSWSCCLYPGALFSCLLPYSSFFLHLATATTTTIISPSNQVGNEGTMLYLPIRCVIFHHRMHHFLISSWEWTASVERQVISARIKICCPPENGLIWVVVPQSQSSQQFSPLLVKIGSDGLHSEGEASPAHGIPGLKWIEKQVDGCFLKASKKPPMGAGKCSSCFISP